jgi:hypothetical protein
VKSFVELERLITKRNAHEHLGSVSIHRNIRPQIYEKVCEFPLFDRPAVYASAPAIRLQIFDSAECEANLQRVRMRGF